MQTIASKFTKKDLVLVLMTALSAVAFTIAGAPLVRLLAKTRKNIFWTTGIVLVISLFLVKSTLIAIYVGAVWMTLGLYSELENKGLSWKKSSAISILCGVVYGGITLALATQRSVDHELVLQLIEPIMNSINQIQPDLKIEKAYILALIPGVFASSLVCAIAASFALESQAFNLFAIRREKTASALRWLEFRTPDLYVWISLFSFLFSLIETPLPYLGVIANNLAILSIVIYFFQGLAIVEFATRIYRVGLFTKLSLYFLIILWAAPFVAVLGLADFWLELRKKMRRKIKVN